MTGTSKNANVEVRHDDIADALDGEGENVELGKGTGIG
jgi:hypothetical protein